MRSAYGALSLQAPRLNRDPDDHIGLEFDFLAQSCLRALDALDAGASGDAQRLAMVGRTFWEDHVQQWAPAVLARVRDDARTSFMKGLAALSLGALESYAVAVAPPP